MVEINAEMSTVELMKLAGDNHQKKIELTDAEHDQLFELLAHRLKRDALVGLQRTDDAASVLLGKKALRHDDEQIHVQADRSDEDQKHQETVA